MGVGCRIRRPHDPAVDEELHERVVARLTREHAVAQPVGARVARVREDEPARRRAEQPGEGRRHALERSVPLHVGPQVPVGDAQARGEHVAVERARQPGGETMDVRGGREIAGRSPAHAVGDARTPGAVNAAS